MSQIFFFFFKLDVHFRCLKLLHDVHVVDSNLLRQYFQSCDEIQTCLRRIFFCNKL